MYKNKNVAYINTSAFDHMITLMLILRVTLLPTNRLFFPLSNMLCVDDAAVSAACSFLN